MTTVSARRLVAETPERIYGFLTDLENHWRLGDAYLRVEALRADRAGARISIRTPWGLRRTASTRVTTTVPPRLFGGTAETGPRTRARVFWTMEDRGDATLVALEATVSAAGPLDRLLLALGGRWWLRRRFDRATERLAHLLEGPLPSPRVRRELVEGRIA